jgi:UDP-N-acetylglucosamine:LPS N-acetylglucosamine transferase
MRHANTRCANTQRTNTRTGKGAQLNPKIDFIYVDSGGGHRAAANALLEVIRQQNRPWDIRLLSIQDLLHRIDFILKSTGIEFQEVYNIILRRGWTLVTPPLVPVAHTLIRLSHAAQVRILEEHWKPDPPGMVVSLIPHYNRAMFQALSRVRPGAPFVTILTDLADYQSNFWMERQNQFVVCPTERSVQQARALGLADRLILPASGVILNPKFYATLPADRGVARESLGLRPGLPTGLILFGGEGSTEIERIVRLLNESGLDMQLIALCGRNQRAVDAVRALPARIPIFAEGFTQEIPHYMALADFFIGKPGPGSISEAIAMRLPVIVERNAWTLPQERYNTEWVEEQGVGIVIKHFGQIAGAVREMLMPERYARFRQAAAAIHNSAVFEIPAMLEEILQNRNNRNLLAS